MTGHDRRTDGHSLLKLRIIIIVRLSMPGLQPDTAGRYCRRTQQCCTPRACQHTSPRPEQEENERNQKSNKTKIHVQLKSDLRMQIKWRSQIDRLPAFLAVLKMPVYLVRAIRTVSVSVTCPGPMDTEMLLPALKLSLQAQRVSPLSGQTWPIREVHYHKGPIRCQ